MKLIYAYFDFTKGNRYQDNYRGFKQVNLNFGTEHYFTMSREFDEEGDPIYRLECKEREGNHRIEPGFWGDERLYNATALVGDNGSGKSTLIAKILDQIMWLPNDFDSHSSWGNSLLLYESVEEKGVYRYSTDSSRGSFVFGRMPGKLYELEREDLFATKLVYLSNVLNDNDYTSFAARNHKTVLHDGSLTAGLLDAVNRSGWSSKKMGTMDEYLDTYFNFLSYQEVRAIFAPELRRILNAMKSEEGLPVPVPTKLKIMVSGIGSYFTDFLQNFDTHIDFFNSVFHSHEEQFAAFLSAHCIRKVMRVIQEEQDKTTLVLPQIRFEHNWEDKDAERFENARAWFLKVLHVVLHENVPTEKMVEGRLLDTYDRCRAYINFVWDQCSFMRRYRGEDVNLYVSEFQASYSVELPPEIPEEIERFVIEFVNNTRAVSDDDYFVTYNWGLSSGERNLLQLFTKLQYALDGPVYDRELLSEPKPYEQPEDKEYKLVNTWYGERYACDSLLLFIDEADLTFHPEWQRRYMEILTKFLVRLFKDPYAEGSSEGCKSIQIIMGTHSPMMLGDFPASSVIYLRKNEDGTVEADDSGSMNTFGQNLYTILKEGFFLKDGTIGALAQSKIKAVIADTTQIREAIRIAQREYEGDPEGGEEGRDEGKQRDGGREGGQQGGKRRRAEAKLAGCSAEEWLAKLNAHEKNTVQYLADSPIRSKLYEEIDGCRLLLRRWEQRRTASLLQQLKQLKQEQEELETRRALLDARIKELEAWQEDAR